MTEAQWLACEDPQTMLAFLRDSGKLTERRVRLFACACCRRVWHLLAEEDSRRAVEAAERHADGLAGQGELESAWRAAAYVADHEEESKAPASACGAADDDAWIGAREASDLAARAAADAAGERVAQCLMLRCVSAGPFRPLAPAVFAWQGRLAVRLAQAAYEDRLPPAGHLDPARLAVLSDALEEAGCADAAILSHLRSAGPHVRGCWALDLILGKQ